MIGYVTIGANDLPRQIAFYELIAQELDTPRMMEWENGVAWARPDGAAGIGVTKPFDGQPATVGNGTMVALQAKDRAQVDRLYRIALDHGGSDEGAPGVRGPEGAGGFYAAYFRDPEGNKLNAFVMG